MLKTNSRQAKDNLKSYIMTAWNLEPEEQGTTWEETQQDIKESFYFQAYRSEYERKQNKQEAFKKLALRSASWPGRFFPLPGGGGSGQHLEPDRSRKKQIYRRSSMRIISLFNL